MDIIAKQAVKAAKQARDALLNEAAVSKVADNTKIVAKLNTVEQIEQILTEHVPVRKLPLFSSSLPDDAKRIFEDEVFLIQGYNSEVCIIYLFL